MNTTKVQPIPNLLNDLVNFGFERIFNEDTKGQHYSYQAPVNITETPTAYKLELLAPGREKSDFVINVENKLLHILYNKKEAAVVEDEKLIKKEFSLHSFKKSFTLTNNVDATNIEANYTNGVLYITIAKKVQEKIVPTTIEIK
jgi:HSP20 family protein